MAIGQSPLESLAVNLRPQATPLEGVYTVATQIRSDERGQFFRSFCAHELEPLLQGRPLRQINLSRTMRLGAVRGLHFQRPPAAEMKFIRCLQGKVWDVAVDVRAHSPTYLHWFAQELSEENRLMMVIPEGFAHGFQVLEPDSRLLYVHSADYRPELEGGLRHDDPGLAIAWPLAPADLSARDLGHPLISEGFAGVSL